MFPNLASQIRTAFASMAWKTGCSSPGELLINAQHLRRGRLLLQRLSKFMRALPLRLEQPRILDGDHGLCGKGPKQINLSLGETADLGSSYENHANGFAFADQRNGQICAQAKVSSNLTTLWVFTGFGLQIDDVDRSPVENGTSSENAARHWQRTGITNGPMVGDEAKYSTVHLMNCRVRGIAKASRTSRHYRENAFKVGRRA